MLMLAQRAGAGGAGALFGCFFFALLYCYGAFSLQTIGKKLGAKDTWMAWIPIVNIYFICLLAGKPGWWLILCLIPIVNIVIGVIVWMAIAENRGKPSWMGILMIIPIVSLVMLGYLAFSE